MNANSVKDGGGGPRVPHVARVFPLVFGSFSLFQRPFVVTFSMTDPTKLLNEKELKWREFVWELRSDSHLCIMKDERDLEGEDMGEVEAMTASLEGEEDPQESFVIFYTNTKQAFSLSWKAGRFQTSDCHPQLHQFQDPADLPSIIGTFSFFFSFFFFLFFWAVSLIFANLQKCKNAKRQGKAR